MAEGVANPSMVDPAAPFETRAALLEWLHAHGLDHLARLSVGVLVPGVDAAFLPQLRAAGMRRFLIELASADSLDQWTREAAAFPKMKELLPRLASRFIEEERAATEEARLAVPERLVPPDDLRTHPVHQQLVTLRLQWPQAVAPRPAKWLKPEALQFDGNLPGWRLQETRGSELAVDARLGFILPEARLTFSPSAASATCSCGGLPCIHALAAIDAALLWLRQPWSAEFGQVLEDLLRPKWDRTLRALDQALAESAGSGRVEISWRLEVIDRWGVEVAPYVHRVNRAGQRSAGARLSRRRLLQDYGAQLSAVDARLAALLPEVAAPASRALLFELVDHPSIRLAETEQLVCVERAKVGVVAEDRAGTVIVTAGVEGAALPTATVDRMRKAQPEDVFYLWDEGPRRLTVLEVSSDLRALLGVFARHGNEFPPESHTPLLERLSQLAIRFPVVMPRSVMGEAVPPLHLPVVRLEAEPGGRLRVELRSRATPDSPAFVPGEGPRDVHVRRGTRAFHAVRDFATERKAAEALQAALPLTDAEPQDAPFAFLLESPEQGMALLAAIKTLEPKPELEWIGRPLHLLASRGVNALQVVLERRINWFGVLGGLSVEGERVELARLLDSARRRERFVQVTETSFVEIEEALRRHLERLSDHAYSSKHGLEVGPSAVETLTALERAGASVETDKTWQALAERIFAARELRPKVPRSFHGSLRDYQLEGFRWLTRLASWNAGAVLADDMGLGKTIQALAVLLDRARLGPALVVAPTSVAFNWIDEAARFAPSLRITLFADAEDRGGTLERLGPKDVLVLSYGLLTRDIQRLATVRFATIVFDEAQSLKNSSTQRFRSARSLQGSFKFALSGTPLENHLGELWTLFAAVFPGLLGSWEAFRTRFATPIEKGVDPTAAPALARILQPFLLRRTKAQVEAQLPPRTEVHVPVVLSPAEWQLYEDTRLAALADLETPKSQMRLEERRIEVLAALTRLRLLASHPRLYDATSKLASSKLERFMELVQELRAEGHRALVFSQFTSHLALVRDVLDEQQITYEYLDGQTPQGARKARVKAFQEGNAQLFLISLKAGGFGLNLTAANSVIHLDPWWNPAVEDQASDRAHRIGQDRPVTIYRLVSRGTIEEQMLTLHQQKRALVASVLDGKELAARLSVRDLLALLSQKLAPPAAINLKATRH